MNDATAKLVQAAVKDERTRLVAAVQRVKWKMLDRARASRETAPSSAKTYEECAELLDDFLLKEVTLGGPGS